MSCFHALVFKESTVKGIFLLVKIISSKKILVSLVHSLKGLMVISKLDCFKYKKLIPPRRKLSYSL